MSKLDDKVNEILNKLTYGNTPLTKELILDTVKSGIKMIDLNANILSNQVYKYKSKKYQELLKKLSASRSAEVPIESP